MSKFISNKKHKELKANKFYESMLSKNTEYMRRKVRQNLCSENIRNSKIIYFNREEKCVIFEDIKNFINEEREHSGIEIYHLGRISKELVFFSHTSSNQRISLISLEKRLKQSGLHVENQHTISKEKETDLIKTYLLEAVAEDNYPLLLISVHEEEKGRVLTTYTVNEYSIW